jgi:hypothetical protein
MSTFEAVATTGALTSAAAFATLSRTAIEDHRLWTHRSLAFRSDSAEKVYRVAGSHLTDTKRWAAVHRVHHSAPDANLEPFVAIADYIDWHYGLLHRHTAQLDIPDEIHGLDPVLKTMDTNNAYEVGTLARELVRGKYRPASAYTLRAAGILLSGKEPRYFYEDSTTMKHDRKNPVKFDPENPPSLHEIRFLLRDPHSPVLHRMGIPGILLYNVPLYGYVENNFQDPMFRPDDLQPDNTDHWTRENRTKLRYAYVGAMILTSVLTSNSKEKIARNAFLGAASSGLAVVALIGGGNITNAYGHSGDRDKLTSQEFLQGVVHPFADGRFTNDDDHWGPATLDEVGGQLIHHDHPDLIAYSLDHGWEKVKKAPFGSILEALADHGIIFKHGDNFNGDRRPDMPSEAVLKLQELRSKYLADQH